MGGCLSLNGTWQLTYAEGALRMSTDYYTGTELWGRQLMPAPVPAPIHQVLMKQGLLDDPNIGLNSLRARWVEEVDWVYRHTFEVPEEAAGQRAWLVFECLELDATVWLNGEEIGQHANANRPARFDVTGKLKVGANLLVVKINAGLPNVADKPASPYVHTAGASNELLTKRAWQRRPGYQAGWDWSPRLLNVGILGDVYLEWRDSLRLDQVTVFALPSEDLSRATVHVRAFVEGICDDPVEGQLTVRIAETSDETALPVSIARGDNCLEAQIELSEPRLWWPVGHGEQFLYDVEVSLEANGERQEVIRRTGVRRVEIDESAHPEEGNYFIVTINNRPIFCKGGNWVPPDVLYSTVSAKRYQQLIEYAVAANFNMLRVWGGGSWPAPAFYEACDEAGLMVWQELLFACGQYPGTQPDFRAEVCREVTWGMRELASHPCIVVWCGNNEIEWEQWVGNYDDRISSHEDYVLFHRDFPRIASQEAPCAAYHISSPYSPDYKDPNDPTCGNQHPWQVSLLQSGPADWWKYRYRVDRFANEGGVIGASPPATLRDFLPEEELSLLSVTWDHHDNPYAAQDSQPGAVGRAYATVKLWTGHDPLAMDWEQYVFVSGLLQAEGIQEYISNYRRRMFSSAAAIFWMYNDCWPATHSWTIVDYYRRKKLAYHPVRRAFAPITVVIAEEQGVVTIYGVNDTPNDWSGEVCYGLFALAGGLPLDLTEPAALPANTSAPLAQFDRSQWEALGLNKTGAFAVLLQDGDPVAQHRLFLERFKDLQFAAPEISMTVAGDRLTLVSETFVWSVCLDVDGEMPLADNCFDLVPGIAYSLPWEARLGEPSIVKIGSRDAVVPPGR